MIESNAIALPHTDKGKTSGVSFENLLDESESPAHSSEARVEDALRMQASRLLSSAPVERESAFGKPGVYADYRPAPDSEGRNLMHSFSKLGTDQQKVFATQWKLECEKRVQSGELSRQELTDTYRQVGKLLNSPSNFLSDSERVNVAAGILYHTGHGRIDQGVHSTCNVNVLQNIAFMEKPSVAAEMIATAALEGTWTAGDGKTIKIPKDSMTPGWEERKFPPEDFLRTHASQIFQVVALNDVGQREKVPTEFVQKPAEIGSVLACSRR